MGRIFPKDTHSHGVLGKHPNRIWKKDDIITIRVKGLQKSRKKNQIVFEKNGKLLAKMKWGDSYHDFYFAIAFTANGKQRFELASFGEN